MTDITTSHIGSGYFSALTPLFAPTSVGVIGASSDPSRIGSRPITYMLAQGFAGDIFPVNPNRAEIQGLRAFPSVMDLPKAPDLGIIAVPRDLAVEAAAQLARRGVKAAIILTSGFAEADERGAALQADIVQSARAHGMRVLGPNCLGVFNASIGFYGTFSASLESGWPVPGRIGIASQSGAYGTHVFASARNRAIGASLVATTGNEADITLGEIIGWMAENDGVDVIAAYAEGIRNVKSFTRALEVARAARKPIVMMKVGHSKLGSIAAKAHTGSTTGNDSVFDAVLNEYGVVRAQSTEELLDIAHMATRRLYPARNTLGVITVSGGAGVVISDEAERVGLAMPAMPEESQQKLKNLISFCSPRNPIDCTAQIENQSDLISVFADELVQNGGYRSIIVFFSQSGASKRAPVIRAQLKKVIEKYPDRLFVLSILAPPGLIQEYERDGFVCMEDPTRAVRAIFAMGRLGSVFAAASRIEPPTAPAFTVPKTRPSAAAVKELFGACGIPFVPEHVCTSAETAVLAAHAIGSPVQLKLLAEDERALAVVRVDADSLESAGNAFKALVQFARQIGVSSAQTKVLVTRQTDDAVRCKVGIEVDHQFGPVASVALAGVSSTIYGDVARHRCPFDRQVALDMIRSLRAAPVLTSTDDERADGINSLANLMARLSVVACGTVPALTSMEIDPVYVFGDGAFAGCADIRVGG